MFAKVFHQVSALYQWILIKQATSHFSTIQSKVVKLDTMKKAQSAPTPATIFSLFIDGKFVTTDISVCMNSRFDKIIGKL